MRDWPDFYIIGAAKSGTSALYQYLRQHPQVFLSPVKEPCYWAYGEWRPDYKGPGDMRLLGVRDQDTYRALYQGVADHHKAVGEASVIYLYSTRAAQRIRDVRPDARFVVLLRQPADRAFSHYLMKLRAGHEMLDDFGEALEAETERMRRNWHPSWYYRDRGYYDRQLAVYASRFPPENFCVVLHDDFERDPQQVVRTVCEFLGLDSRFVPDVAARHNEGGTRPRSPHLARLVRSNSARMFARTFMTRGLRRTIRSFVDRASQRPASIPPDVREALTAGYREDILRLQDRLRRDLSGWLAGGIR
jgi:hypothetical protein